ncbi:MAG: fatty acid desaturase [Methylacidiphilales bacterium]|nr:fatty acid desaturase [Candidatus Methylacidiphilales bacterium]
MNDQIKINWYRCKVDKPVMSDLMKTSDFRGFCQVIPQLALFLATGTLAYLAYRQIDVANWMWSVPLLLAALFVHGTFSSFLGGTCPAVHELCHKTPFKSKAWNEFFLKIYSFIGWTDYIWFRPSHVKHHQATVHADYDGEVVLPQKLDWQSVKFFAMILAFDPYAAFCRLRDWVRMARGKASDWKAKGAWYNQVLPESNEALRCEHRNWARIVLFGHLALAALFIATGHWFLIVVFTFGTFYTNWLNTLCWLPQHIGMSPNVPDFRLCCRTYTCGWLPAFLYWNMQYHVEHHMFPAVPFFNLPKLRKAIEHDLPPAPHGLWATWKHILSVVKLQREDPSYVFIPKLPQGFGERVGDTVLELEASAQAA